MPTPIPKIRMVCGNKKCQHLCEEPAMEINFFTEEIHYICPDCGYDNKLSLKNEAKPLARTKRIN